MFNLFDVLLLILFCAACAWLWRGHGIRERALLLARQHCAKLDIELLDGNVAFRRLALLRDSRGRRRVARIYDFEFTVTGEQRLNGSIRMYGRHFGAIELAPYPFDVRSEPQARQETVIEQAPPSAKVVSLSDWRRQHPS